MKKFRGSLTIIAVFFAGLLIWANVAAQSTTLISDVQLDKNSVPTFEKIEWTFNINKEFANPYYYYDPSDTRANNPKNMTWVGEDGVSVDLNITQPNGTQIKVPAFIYEDYSMKEVGGIAVLGRKSNPVWKARFAAPQSGTYNWYISVQDKNGTFKYPNTGTNSFIATSSNNKGFIKVSEKDSRFMNFSNTGEAFIGVGSSGSVWASDSSLSFDYEDKFKEMNANGINLLRIWDQSDFSLSVEGANPVWNEATTMSGPAKGVNVGEATAKDGLRSANPTTNQWYQRILVSQVNTPHTLKAWVKGSARVSLRSVSSNATIGNILAETQAANSTDWTQVSLSYTPTTDLLAVYLSGSGSVDVVEFGPKSGDNIAYNILSDHNFERHFSKDNPNNDPNSNPSLARPLGNYFNQWSSFHLDKIISDAKAYQVYLQLCSCSGPWFTWPANPESPNEANYSDEWWLKSWQRNFRYRVARWGYSTSIMAWEKKNEHGHITPGSAAYTFYQKYGAFQKAIDPYKHLRTTSQGSQSVSPAFWSDSFFDIANYHDYAMSSRYPAELYGDISNFIYRFAWCLREFNNCKDPALGIGDGTQWSSAPKPWIWGEIGAGMVDWNSPPSDMVSKGEGGSRYIHNVGWAGLFSPLGTTPLDWTLINFSDDISKQAYFSSRKSLNNFFKDVSYDAEKFIYTMTQADKPTWLTAPITQSSDSKIRVYGMISQSKQKVYAWIQHRDHEWSKVSNPLSAISGSVTFPGIENGTYKVEYWNTRTGTIESSVNLTVSNNSLTLQINNLSKDIAIKAINSNTPAATPSQTSNPSQNPTSQPSPAVGNGDTNGDSKVDQNDLWTVIRSWSAILSNSVDQFKDGVINSLDISVVINKIRTTSTPAPATPSATAIATTAATPGSTNPPTNASTEWNQHGANAQRTSYVNVNIPHPWRWKWSWNGPSSNGSVVAGKTSLPRNVQAVTGDGRVYIGAGDRGVIALNIQSGNQDWTVVPGGSINSTVAYDATSKSVYAVSTNGYLYKLNAATGQTTGSYNGNGSSTLPLPPLLTDSSVVFSMGTKVFSINKNDMSVNWSYNANNEVHTPPTYSATRNRIIIGTADLYVHAINNSNGAQAWRTKPTVRQTGASQTELSRGWPVVADKTGLVLIKYRLDWDTLWTWSPWPTTNAQIRANLIGRPDQIAMFALNLDNGSVPFNSNIGHGGYGDGNYMPMGPQPVVKDLGTTETVYMSVRGDSVYDGRWDSHFGEVVIDNSVPGYQPGDIRFIEYGTFGWNRHGSNYGNVAATPTDEQPNLSMAGNYLLGGHWMNAYSMVIEDRSAQYGTYSNPIRSAPAPHITASTNQSVSGCTLSTTHYCNRVVQDEDIRTFPDNGFYIYYNQGRIYDQYWTGYAGWSASGNTMLFRSSDGAIIALESGTPTASNSLNEQLRVAGVETKQTKSPTTVIGVDDAEKYVGAHATVRGTLKEVFNNKKAVYLTFHKPHNGKFVIKIEKSNWKEFNTAPEKLFKANQSVEVSGEIEWYQGGPVIYLENPSQIRTF